MHLKFNTIQSEGSLISAEILSEIYSGEAIGQKAKDFALDKNVRLTDEIAACWTDAKAFWEAFKHSLRKVSADQTGASQTREQWILPLLRILGFEGITFSKSAAQVGGRTYFISHRLGEGDNGLPIHIEGANVDLDKRSPTGRPRISPHALVQEYLNRTEHLWGLVTNGKKFRILRDTERLSRPTYLEFDLEQIMDGEHFSEFQLFYRIIHRTRWPKKMDDAHECLLEQYYQQGIEAGGRVRERLRDGVEAALKIFGNGFLNHPYCQELKINIQSGKISTQDYYRNLLRLIYRFLFLMVSEERNLVGPDPQNDHFRKIYDQFYSISRLRQKVEQPVNVEDRHWDLWESVKKTFQLYSDQNIGQMLGIAPFGGQLFSENTLSFFDNAFLYNKDFLHGFAHLSIFKAEKVTRRISYGHLDVEELGSVYESLLEYNPLLRCENGRVIFEFTFGTERKSTGSYYTRPELVNELIKSALVPVMEDRLDKAQTKENKEEALLSLKVCDPASGSGHFLLAAARRIGAELAKIRTGEEHPTPSQFRAAVRDVVRHCIYGVDLNPLAVDLCKVALWMEGHNRDLPLTFLDHRIKCGNSLIGLDKMERILDGIPDEAFKPVTGDNKEVAKKIKALNRQQRQDWDKKQLSLEFNLEKKLHDDLDQFSIWNKRISDASDKAVEDYQGKSNFYENIKSGGRWWNDWTAANIWTSAFFYPLTDENDPAIPTHDKLMGFLQNPNAAHGQLVGKANALALEHRFFHWPLEFPDVFEFEGFDIVLGNPPFSSELDNNMKDLLNHLYTNYGTTNTAAIFILLSYNLVNQNGCIGLVNPKSITYSMRWKNIRQFIIPKLLKIIDCGKAWEEVLLEQVLITIKKSKRSEIIQSGKFIANCNLEIHETNQSFFIQRDVLLTDIEILLYSIINRIRDWVSFGSICKTYRGLGLQNRIRNVGDLIVYGGKDIARFRIKSSSGFLIKDDIAGDIDKFKPPKAIFQNIVAHIINPKPHIKLIGFADHQGIICLDTVNILKPKNHEISVEAIVGILTSKMLNWLIYRLIYNKAIRTMHFDQYFLDKIPIPTSLLKISDEIGTIVNEIQENLLENKNNKASSNIEDMVCNLNYMIYEKFRINNDEIKIIEKEFPKIDI